MNDPAATERALFAAVLGVLAEYAKGNLEDLAGRLAELVDAAQGDGLPGGRDMAIPPRQLDATQRRGVIVNVLRSKGRLTSGSWPGWPYVQMKRRGSPYAILP